MSYVYHDGQLDLKSFQGFAVGYRWVHRRGRDWWDLLVSRGTLCSPLPVLEHPTGEAVVSERANLNHLSTSKGNGPPAIAIPEASPSDQDTSKGQEKVQV